MMLCTKISNANFFLGDDYATALNKIKTDYWPGKTFTETKIKVAENTVNAIIVYNPSEFVTTVLIIFGVNNKCIVEDWTWKMSYLQTKLRILNGLYKNSPTEANTWIDGTIKYTLRFDQGHDNSFDEIVTYN